MINKKSVVAIHKNEQLFLIMLILFWWRNSNNIDSNSMKLVNIHIR